MIYSRERPDASLLTRMPLLQVSFSDVMLRDNFTALFSSLLALRPKSLLSQSAPANLGITATAVASKEAPTAGGAALGGGSIGSSYSFRMHEGYVKSIYIKSSMTPSVMVNVTSLASLSA